MWLTLLLKIGFYAFNEYTKNTDSKQDDKILDFVQLGAQYLAPKSNNDMTKTIANGLSLIEMKQTQRSR